MAGATGATAEPPGTLGAAHLLTSHAADRAPQRKWRKSRRRVRRARTATSQHRLDQHPRPRAGRGRRPARHRRHRRRAERGARPPGPQPGPRPAGKALLYSAILRPLDERHLLLPLSVPIAVCEAAEALRPGIECQIKWPNDVWLEERKLAGILIEARPQDGWAVIGVGLNLSVAPDEFPRRAALTRRSRSSARARGVGGRVAGATAGGSARPFPDPRLPQPKSEPPPRPLGRARTRTRSSPSGEPATPCAGREICLGRSGSGVADGVDDRGNLLVVTAGGDRVALGAGEVHLRL